MKYLIQLSAVRHELSHRYSLLGAFWGKPHPLAERLVIPPTWKNSLPHQIFIPPCHQRSIQLIKQFSCYDLIKTSFLALVITPVPFLGGAPTSICHFFCLSVCLSCTIPQELCHFLKILIFWVVRG